MVYVDVNIGQRGQMRCDVTLLSQNAGANTSTIRVTGSIRLTSGGPSGDLTGNCKASFSGDISYGQVSYTFDNLYTSWRPVIHQDYTVGHNADGTKNISVSFHFGPTITQNLGSGGTATVYTTLTRIPKPPSKVTGLAGFFEDPTNVTLTWSEASGGIDPVTNYQVKYWRNETPGSPGYVTVGSTPRARLISFETSTSGYSFQVQAKNSAGWGAWSDILVKNLSSIPTPPTNVDVVYTSASSGDVSYTAPSSMGSSTFQKYQIQWSTAVDFSTNVTTVESTTTSATISGFSPGEKIYIRVRAVTASGRGYWSTADQSTAPSGPSIKYQNSWRQTVAYVKVDGVWKVAVPYIKINGEWRLASS